MGRLRRVRTPDAFLCLFCPQHQECCCRAPQAHSLRGQRMKSDSEGGEKLLILKSRGERDGVSSSCLPSSFLPMCDGMGWLPFLKGLQVAPATRLPPRLGYRRRYLHVRSFSLGCIHFQPMPLVGQTSSYSICNEQFSSYSRPSRTKKQGFYDALEHFN